jgi:hypothetical protein
MAQWRGGHAACRPSMHRRSAAMRLNLIPPATQAPAALLANADLAIGRTSLRRGRHRARYGTAGRGRRKDFHISGRSAARPRVALL